MLFDDSLRFDEFRRSRHREFEDGFITRRRGFLRKKSDC